MIQNSKEQSQLHAFKWKLLNFQMTLFNHKNYNNYLGFLLSTIIYAFLRTIILWKADFLKYQPVNTVIKGLLGENWSSLMNIEGWILDTIMITVMTLLIVIFLVGFHKKIGIVHQFLYWSYSIGIIVTPLFLSFNASNLNQLIHSQISPESVSTDQQILWLKLLEIIEYIIICTVFFFLVFHDLKPVRQNNIFWKISNKLSFYQHLIDIGRFLIFTFGNFSIIPLCISLLVEFSLKYVQDTNDPQTYYGYLNPTIKVIDQISIDLVIITHFSVLVSVITDDKTMATKIFFISILWIIIKTVTAYQEAGKKIDSILPCRPENRLNIYNFYFEFIKKNKSGKMEISEIISMHQVACNEEQCMFKTDTKNVDENIQLNQFTRKITKFFKKYRYTDPKSQVLYELWKYQLNLKVSITNRTRNFTPENYFVMSYIMDKRISEQLFTQILNENRQGIDSHKLVFLKEVEEIVDKLQILYIQLMKAKPELSVINESVYETYTTNKNTILLFERLHRQRKLDYLLVELYSNFIHTFYENSRIEGVLEKRLNNIKVEKDHKTLKKTDRPSFYVSAESGKIQQFNAQTMKFLRLRKFQIRDKHFIDFYEPKIPLNILYEKVKAKKGEKIFMFILKNPKIHDSQKQYQSFYIDIECRSINNRLTYIVTLQKKEYNPKTFDILVDNKFQLVACDRKSIMNYSSEDYLVSKISSTAFYKQYLQGQIKKIEGKQSFRVYFEDSYGNQSACDVSQQIQLSSQIRSFSIRMFNNSHNPSGNIIRPKINQRSHIAFVFHYDQDFCQRLQMKGTFEKIETQTKIGKKMRKSCQTQKQQKRIKELIVSLCAPKTVSLSNGIMTYRLVNQELYNVDLQDKAAYERQFDHIKPIERKEIYKQKYSPQFLIGCNLFLILLILGITIYTLFQKKEIAQKLQVENQQLENMNLFILELNLLNGALDIDSGDFSNNSIPYQSFMTSYNNIQKYTARTLFKQHLSYQVQFDNHKINGALNQLIEYGLFYSYKIVNENKPEFINQFHQFCYNDLLRLMKQQQQQMRVQTQKNFNELQLLVNVQTFLIMGLALLFSFCIIGICSAYKMKLAIIMRPFLMLSDSSIKRLLEESRKFKQSIMGASKNYEISFDKGEENKTQNDRYRSKPKNIKTSFSTKISEILCAMIALALFIVIIFTKFMTFSQQIQRITEMITQEQALIESYSHLCEASNSLRYVGVIEEQILESLDKSIQIIQQKLQSYQFSENLISDISTIFLSKSCDYLASKQFLPVNSNCSNSQPNFIIPNPFELGLSVYFRYQFYNLKNNLNETRALVSGVHSSIYRSVFTDFRQRTTKEKAKLLEQIHVNTIIFNFLIIFVGISEILIMMGIFFYFNFKQNSLAEIIMDLSIKQRIQKTEKVRPFQPPKENPEHSQSDDQISSENSIIQ